MSFCLDPREENGSVESYDQILKTYKKLNGIINVYDQWEKNIIEKEDKLKRAQEEIDQKKYQQENELNQYMEYLRTLEKSVQDASKSYVFQQEELRNKEKQLKQALDSVASLENQLRQKEEKLKQKEKALVDREGYFTNRDQELTEKEEMLKKVESELIATTLKSVQHNLKFERTHAIEYRPNPENGQMTFREESGFDSVNSAGSGSLKKMKVLEDENYQLFIQNKSLQEEVIRLGLGINSEKAVLIKEREQVIIKDNQLKSKEQSIKKRENELVEKTRFVNSMILAVNQQLKIFRQREITHIREETDHDSRTPLDTKKDVHNYSNLFYGTGDSKDNSENIDELSRCHAKIAKLSRDFADKFDLENIENSYDEN